MTKRPGAAALVFACATALLAPAATAAPTATMTAFGGWQVACPAAKEKSCVLYQAQDSAETKQLIAQLEIRRENGADVIIATLPLDTLLEPDMAYQFGSDAPQLVAFETCDDIGCYSSIPFAGDFAKTFEQATTMRLLAAGLDGQPFGIAFDMTGFAEALADYRAKEAERGGK